MIIHVQSVRSRWATRSGCAADAMPMGIWDASRSLWWKATRSASSALHGQKMKSKKQQIVAWKETMQHQLEGWKKASIFAAGTLSTIGLAVGGTTAVIAHGSVALLRGVAAGAAAASSTGERLQQAAAEARSHGGRQRQGSDAEFSVTSSCSRPTNRIYQTCTINTKVTSRNCSCGIRFWSLSCLPHSQSLTCCASLPRRLLEKEKTRSQVQVGKHPANHEKNSAFCTAGGHPNSRGSSPMSRRKCGRQGARRSGPCRIECWRKFENKGEVSNAGSPSIFPICGRRWLGERD